jgi:GTPase SAR1 family protein
MDMLRIKFTQGIVGTKFTIGETVFCLTELGGARNERRKWIHIFEDVSALIYVVNMSDYDMKMEKKVNKPKQGGTLKDEAVVETTTVNRMHECLKLFNSIINNQWFANTTVILLLNKMDLFEKKIEKVNLNVCFPEYSGGLDFEAASLLMEKMYTAQNNTPDTRTVYAHMCCGLDTKNVETVFNRVHSDIIAAMEANRAI